MRHRAVILLVSLAAPLSGCGGSDSTGPQPPAPPASGAPAEAKTYTCPMHPEILSDKPGKCPKCGMALVLKK